MTTNLLYDMGILQMVIIRNGILIYLSCKDQTSMFFDKLANNF